MSSSADIPENALVLRHIPGGTSFQQPPELRITSSNFQLRPGESGISVFLASPENLQRDAARLLRLLARSPDSRIASAPASDLIAMGFVIVRKPTIDDPNHAELIPKACDLSDRALRKKVAAKFSYCTPLPPER